MQVEKRTSSSYALWPRVSFLLKITGIFRLLSLLFIDWIKTDAICYSECDGAPVNRSIFNPNSILPMWPYKVI